MLYRIFALLMFVPFSAQAIECESKSPLLETMGDAYYDLSEDLDEVPALKEPPLKQAIETLGQTEFRSGHATRIICKRVDGELTPLTRTYLLKDADSHYTLNGNINISMRADDKDNRSIHQYKITLPLSIAWETGNATNEWNINHRFRSIGKVGVVPEIVDQGTATSAGYDITHSMVELDIAFTLLDKGIGVMQTIYTNGYLAEQSSWTLTR